MKATLALAALTLALHFSPRAAEPAPAQSFEARLQQERVMTAAPDGKRVCLQFFRFDFDGKSLALNAADKETANLSLVDIAKPCTILVSEDLTTNTRTILRVEQAGKTLYTKPDAAK